LRVRKFEQSGMQQLSTVTLGFIWKVRLQYYQEQQQNNYNHN